MEMNKGEAEKCRDIAKRFLREGKWQQAIKFFEKSHRMFPLPGVEAMCERAKSELAKEQSGHTNGAAPAAAASAPSEGMRRRSAAPSDSSSADEPSRPYTNEQVHIVNKIRACKTHYDVLSVARDADENTIKKAYRKLALRLHPDKNSAPGAEDAFKAVGKAFTVLSDPDKREHYDRFGDAPPQQQMRGRRGGGGGYYEEDISPEEIFNMFFGGGFHPRRRRPQPQHQGRTEPRDGRTMLLQFLPILLIFVLSIFSIPSTPDTPFSLQANAKYNVQRETKMRGVAKGIPYYVEPDFDPKYTGHWQELLRVEQLVEQYHMSHLADSCENQKMRQQHMIYQARRASADVREAQISAAVKMKLRACEELKALRRSRMQ